MGQVQGRKSADGIKTVTHYCLISAPHTSEGSLLIVRVCACQVPSIVSDSLRPYGLQLATLLSPCREDSCLDPPGDLNRFLPGFLRQEYWSGLPCPPPGDLLHSGIEPMSPVFLALQEDSLLLSHQGSPTTKPPLLPHSSIKAFKLHHKGNRIFFFFAFRSSLLGIIST